MYHAGWPGGWTFLPCKVCGALLFGRVQQVLVVHQGDLVKGEDIHTASF
jgi:hypothetical protein